LILLGFYSIGVITVLATMAQNLYLSITC